MREAYVVNLARRPDRLEAFNKRMVRLAGVVRFERFEAVDGRALDLAAVLQRVRPDRRERGAEAYMRGALGCALSHVALWERIARSTARSVLVFEDDAAFLRAVRASEFEAILASAPADLDLLWLNDDMYPRLHGRVRWAMRGLLRALPSGPAEPGLGMPRRAHQAWRYWRWRARVFKTNEAYLITPAAARFLAGAIANDLLPVDVRVKEAVGPSNLRVFELRDPLFTQVDRSDTYGTYGL